VEQEAHFFAHKIINRGNPPVMLYSCKSHRWCKLYSAVAGSYYSRDIVSVVVGSDMKHDLLYDPIVSWLSCFLPTHDCYIGSSLTKQDHVGLVESWMGCLFDLIVPSVRNEK
jgi:hypothetical protein